MQFSWAENYPDLHKTCTLFQLSELSEPRRFSYKPLPSYIQEGPQCGLVALAICAGAPSTGLIQSIFDKAKSEGYTINGEMFSAKDMTELARQILPIGSKIRLYSGFLDTPEIREFLLEGDIMLVPYDNDVNNSPCKKRGHSAHWAVISGAVETIDNFYVIARHGVTKSIVVWKLTDLARSNSQLIEFSPKRGSSITTEYKLPLGGFGGELGLKLKSVLLSNL